MSKISIVGVEGSGKTTLMAAFGEKYERPDKYGYFLAAETPQTFHAVKMLMDRMRHGEWPGATVSKSMTGLDWTLYRRDGLSNESLCSVSFLDFAGEIYRLAFGNHSDEEREAFKTQVSALRQHIGQSDALLVMVNLKDVIDGDLSSAKTRETLWLSRNIVDFALKDCGIRHVALAFSQFDVYREIVETAGGLRGAYVKYLPHIECLYPSLDLLPLSAVDRTKVDVHGMEMPAADFMSNGLEMLMEWLVSCVPGHETEIRDRRERPQRLWNAVLQDRSRFGRLPVGDPERLRLVRQVADNIALFQALPPDERASVASEENLTETVVWSDRTLSEEQCVATLLEQEQTMEGFVRMRDGLTKAVERGEIRTESRQAVFERIAEMEAAVVARRRIKRNRLLLCFGVLIGVGALVVSIFIGIDKVQRQRRADEIRRAAEEKHLADERMRTKTREALEAFGANNYYKGMALAKESDQSDATLQFYLGCCYVEGLGGVEKDSVAAAKWFRHSAEQGNLAGQCNYGYCLVNGLGVERDDKEAVKWTRLSAEHGHSDGQCNLAMCYEYGRGIEKNMDEAVKWYKKAASQGNERAQKALKKLNLTW